MTCHVVPRDLFLFILRSWLKGWRPRFPPVRAQTPPADTGGAALVFGFLSVTPVISEFILQEDQLNAYSR